MSSVYDTIIEILTTKFAVPANAITANTALEDVLTDSLDVVEFGVVVGERYNILISDDELMSVTTIADVAGLMSGKVAA